MLTRGYRIISLVLALAFAATGGCFLLIPAGVVGLFNRLAADMGMPVSPNPGMNFYVALTGAYMYLVTLLAVKMALKPGERIYPRLLAHAKAASAVISLGLFVFFGPYLILLANAAVDGLLALLSIGLHRSTGHTGP